MGLVVLDSKQLCAVSIAALVLVACTGAREEATTRAQSLGGIAAPGPQPDRPIDRGAPLGERAEEPEALLDARSDGARLLGIVLAAPLGGDPERVLRVRAERLEPALVESLAGQRVLDARFAGEGVVMLGVDHVLRFFSPEGEGTAIDAQAQPPLSVAGARVAYARGEMPFFELARADLATGAVVTLTEGLAPVWSPALSEDGTAVAFVSSASGRPRLMRLEPDGSLVTLPAARFPTSPRAPRWVGRTLTFEDERGTATIDLDQEVAP
ncbi:MAG: hypothetical protein U0234_09845 [Sandaracinus sp.]